MYAGKYLEELTPGLRIQHVLTRTVTEADNVLFTCLTLNPAPIHLDHELSKNTEFGIMIRISIYFNTSLSQEIISGAYLVQHIMRFINDNDHNKLINQI